MEAIDQDIQTVDTLTDNTNGNNGNTYDESNIKVLEGLEAVRMRPAMYIGDVGERGLHHLIQEVVDNSIDEALAGYCDSIIVTLHNDGSCSIEDNGRGIPIGIHPVKKIPTLELILCSLHSGGKFDKGSYQVSGGLHGVGVSCVNALSTTLIATIKREGIVVEQKFQKGKPVTEQTQIGKSNETGTVIRFYPDPTIFTDTVIFKYATVVKRLRELAFLNPQVSITLTDEREMKSETFHYPGGLIDFINYADEGKNILVEPIKIQGAGTGASGFETRVEVCLQYNDGYSENLLSYVNNIHTIEGGTHVSGFRSALTSTLNNYIKNNVKNNKIDFIGDDFKEGLTTIISVMVAVPQFEGQTKTKLGNGEVDGLVRSIVSEKLNIYLDENPNIAKMLIDKATMAAEARIASRKARDLTRSKNKNKLAPKKGFVDCSCKIPELRELFIVEGNSAAGTAKTGRDAKNQCLLSLRGKVINVQKTNLIKVLKNAEIATMIQVIGSGFKEDFDVTKAKFGKIILMADADIDGSHIRTLLLTFFYNYMRDLIVHGKLYIAQPPLYKIEKGKKEYYAFDDKQRDEITSRIRKEAQMAKANKKDEPTEEVEEAVEETTNEASDEEVLTKTKDGITISRFKGLGEMNAEQLWETTMNPETRTLLKVEIEDATEAARIFETLMGENVDPRRNFIEANAEYVKNLDV